MRKVIGILSGVSLVFLVGLSAFAQAATGPYLVSKTIQIGGEGGFDYLTVDSQHHLLYVPRSTHTQVVDAAAGKMVADIPGQKGNHGVALVPELNRGFISDGKDASVVVFDLKTNKALGKVKAAEDADGIIYDPSTKKVLVSCGDANSLVIISADVDPKAGAAGTTVALGGKPEFLAADGHGKVYVNLEDKNQVAAVDIKAGKVLDKWSTTPGGAPVGMSIDAEHGHLFIGCRNPQKLVVMNVADGKVLADLPIGAGVDATAFDSGDAFASCRDGSLTVARETAPGKFEVVQTVKTRLGAKTLGIDTATHDAYLPTAEFEPQANAKARPAAKPNSFMIVVVQRANR